MTSLHWAVVYAVLSFVAIAVLCTIAWLIGNYRRMRRMRELAKRFPMRPFTWFALLACVATIACGGRFAPDVAIVRDDSGNEIVSPDDAAAPAIACLTWDAGPTCIVGRTAYACNACGGSSTFVVFSEADAGGGSVAGTMSECTNTPCSSGLSCVVDVDGLHLDGVCAN